MRQLLVVVLLGTALLEGSVCRAQDKPAPKAPGNKAAPDNKAGGKKESAPGGFTVHRPYHLLRQTWDMTYGGRFVLVEAAFLTEDEAKTKCRGIRDIVPGFLFAGVTGFQKSVWYCLQGRAFDQLPAYHVLKQHKPINDQLTNKDVSLKFAGTYQPVDIGSLQIQRTGGLRVLTALSDKMLLAIYMEERPGFRPRGAEDDYGYTWPLDHKRYRGAIRTFDPAGKQVGNVAFESCGVNGSELAPLSDGTYLLMLMEEHQLPRRRYHDYTRFFVWSQTGKVLFSSKHRGSPARVADQYKNNEVALERWGGRDEFTIIKWDGKVLVKVR